VTPKVELGFGERGYVDRELHIAWAWIKYDRTLGLKSEPLAFDYTL